MFARPRHLALALWLALPATAWAQSFEYAPGKGQYLVTQKTVGAQEAMGQKQDFETSSRQLLSVTVARPSRDTVALDVVVDSIAILGPMGMTPPGLDKLVGVKVAAKVSPFGAFYSAEGPSDTSIMQAAQLTDELGRFLPRVRGNLAVGSTWTDTTTGKVRQGGMEIDRRVVSKFTVVGDTTVGVEKSWKVERETTATMSGSGAPQGQPVTMEGTSSAKGTLLISPKGVFLGSQSEDQVDIKILLSTNGMEIGVKQTSNTKVEKVK